MSTRVEQGARVILQVQPEHYWKSYDSKARFCSYWTQIEVVLASNSPPVLEIGIGNATVSHYLRHLGIPLTTLDLDHALGPDIQASVLSLPFADGSFGTVMACQVLEHLPFEQSCMALRELARVSSTCVIVSVPNVGRAYPVLVHVPKFGSIQKLIELPWLRRRKSVQVVGEHFWELEMDGYPAAKLRTAIREAGLVIIQDFRVFENPFHHFFVLRKQITNVEQ